MADHRNSAEPGSALRRFLDSEAAGGILLIGAAALAMVAANGPWHDLYHDWLHRPLAPALVSRLGPITPHFLINDGLMAIFFLLVGLEIKREWADGRLSTWKQRRLPAIAAAAGMAVPALIYFLLTPASLSNGWAIPAATDIAFAVGVLALLGSRAPNSLRLFLVTVAIVDDIGAVAIIAIFYTKGLDLGALAAASAILLAMVGLARIGMRSLPLYLILAAALWYAVLLSGVHSTIAGVLAAMAIPIVRTDGAPDSDISPLHRLEHGIAPFVAFFVVPLFGFANAGVSFSGLGLGALFAPLPLSIAAGLFIGKQIGIFGAVFLCIRLGFANRLRGATWLQVYGVSLLCGVGFTMSLFIGSLAFPGQPGLIEEAKLGTLLGSLLSAVAGYAVLRLAPLHEHHWEADEEERREIRADGDVKSIEEVSRG